MSLDFHFLVPESFHIKVKVTPGSSFEQTMMGWSPQCYILSFMEISPPVPEKIFEGFLKYI